MRKIWVSLVLIGTVPAFSFYVFKWLGWTRALGYVATTGWMPGHPSVFEIACMFGSMIAWAWLKGFIYLFVPAAVPFLLADLFRSRRACPPAKEETE